MAFDFAASWLIDRILHILFGRVRAKALWLVPPATGGSSCSACLCVCVWALLHCWERYLCCFIHLLSVCVSPFPSVCIVLYACRPFTTAHIFDWDIVIFAHSPTHPLCVCAMVCVVLCVWLCCSFHTDGTFLFPTPTVLRVFRGWR